MDNNLVWLGEPICQQQTLVGNKAANLSRLAATYSVPPGFCLTTAAFVSTSLHQNIGVNPMLPPALTTLLTAAYQELARRCQQTTPAVAVRSSAVGEDGLAASFAGQYATYLNIIGEAALCQAVVDCWASAQSTRVSAYRQQQGTQQEAQHGQMAVLVQQLVTADVAIVAFSTHPVTGDRSEIVINATWGLGESLVGGTVTPDEYRVRKADLVITHQEQGEKTVMTMLAPNGVCETPVPRSRQLLFALTAEQVRKVAELTLRLEREMGWAVDIECAYQQDKLYLLQCRPITSTHGGACHGASQGHP